MFLLAASRDDLPRPSEKMLGTRDA
jgi:hypothetical protein